MCGETRIPRDVCAGNTHHWEINIPVTPIPGFSHLFPKYFSLIFSLFAISQLFLPFISVISHFSLIFQIFLISRRCFSFFSVILPNYFSVTSQLFPSESPDISAIASWSCSCSTHTDCWSSWTKSSFYFSVCVRGGKLSGKEQAEAILNKKSSSSGSSSYSFMQKAATFSAPGSSKNQQHYCTNHCSNHCEGSKVAAGTFSCITTVYVLQVAISHTVSVYACQIIIASALGDKKTPDGGLKRAELLMKYV